MRTIPNRLDLVMLLIFEALVIQVEPNSLTNMNLWFNSMLVMQCLVLGLCLLKDGLCYEPWPSSAQKKKLCLSRQHEFVVQLNFGHPMPYTLPMPVEGWTLL
jgi:hypothetical protein